MAIKTKKPVPRVDRFFSRSENYAERSIAFTISEALNGIKHDDVRRIIGSVMYDLELKHVTKSWKPIEFSWGRLIKNNPRASRHSNFDSQFNPLNITRSWVDHIDMWKDERGNVVATFQPYDLAEEDVEEIVRCCKENGLWYKIRPCSWHYYGRCFTVTLRRFRFNPGDTVRCVPYISKGNYNYSYDGVVSRLSTQGLVFVKKIIDGKIEDKENMEQDIYLTNIVERKNND
jgi:hypothetical protein